AEPDVQVVLLAEAPAVALQVRAEIKLGPVGLDLTQGLLAGTQGKLDLLGGYRRFIAAELGAEVARDGAEVSARAHQHGGADGAVDHPLAAVPLQLRHGFPQTQPRPAAGEQVMVEFATADAVAHRA